MDQQWKSTAENSMNQAARYGTGIDPATLQSERGASGQAQPYQTAANYNYDRYRQNHTTSGALSMASSPPTTRHLPGYNGVPDVPMEDADPYNRAKYPSRPAHQHRLSGQYLFQEGSSAAQRYCPMQMLSPTAPYASSPQSQGQNSVAYQFPNHNSRHSPSRQNFHANSSRNYQNSPSRCSAE